MPKIREPYTYNTSTYFGYMLAEDPSLDLVALREFITGTLENSLRNSPLEVSSSPLLGDELWRSRSAKRGGVVGLNFNHYSSFCIVIPNEFVLLREMFETKFIELFGRKVARDVFSYEQMKHATTVVQDSRELFLCFGNETGIVYGINQIDLPIFDTKSYAAMMLVGYYVVGKIQTALSPYFMDSIAEYCTRAKAQSGFNIAPWVEV